MHHGAAAYASTAKVTATTNPRDLEASLLLRAAARLQSVKDNWETGKAELGPALAYNRKLWTILSTSATQPDNPLPLPIKNNIANLGLFIFQRTIDIEIAPAPEKLGILVTINSNIAAGLAGRG
jgi:flagellar protein FlaF